MSTPKVKTRPVPSDCPYCGVRMIGEYSPTREHVLPLSRGGDSHVSNMLWVCSPCNHDKGNLTLCEWEAKLRGTGDARVPFVSKIIVDGHFLIRQPEDKEPREIELQILAMDYGWPVVEELRRCGVKRPAHIRRIIRVVLDNARILEAAE